MIDDKAVAANLAKYYTNQGTKTHQAVLVARNGNKNFRGAWVVACSDRINIANTMEDLCEWADDDMDPAMFDLSHVNTKRAQFDLPPLSMDTIQEPDRKAQPRYTNWKEFIEEEPYIFPTEADAEDRIR